MEKPEEINPMVRIADALERLAKLFEDAVKAEAEHNAHERTRR